MAACPRESNGQLSENKYSRITSPVIPLSDYANRLENKVKQRYLEKTSAIGINPILMEGKNLGPDRLPPVESTELLFYLMLETSFYTKQQFKAFRSLHAHNQMVSGSFQVYRATSLTINLSF